MGGRYYSYFNTVILLVKSYDGSMPLVHFLKHYFAQYKKHGSKDRKFISHLFYCYYRLGHSINTISIEERIRLSLFLCNDEVGEWSILFNDLWLANWATNRTERIAFAQQQVMDFVPEKIFPWQDELSDDIDANRFSLAHLVQPNLFLRIRPGHEKTVIQRLRNTDISFQKITANSLALVNGTKLDGILYINEEAVVQDLSSQAIANFITPELVQLNWEEQWSFWDCCVASGGKTILLHDVHANNDWYLSDVRESMLHQLKPRLHAAHIRNWKFDVLDLTKQNTSFQNSPSFDFIIADVPCTGSGTWARTPEQIENFTINSIQEFALRQKMIVANIIPQLKKDGYLLYITCSVFKKENEEVVAFIKEKFQLIVIKMEVLKGYNNKADTMFGALLRKLN